MPSLSKPAGIFAPVDQTEKYLYQVISWKELSKGWKVDQHMEIMEDTVHQNNKG